MAKIRSRGTLPERQVLRALRALKLRYTTLTDALPGRPDFIVREGNCAVMVHGCFWHQHKGCIDGKMPSTRVDYWVPKLLRNQQRDSRVKRQLRRAGYSTLTIWECEAANPDRLAKRLRPLAQKAR